MADARLTLYSRHSCHLCEDMTRILTGLTSELGVELTILDIDTDPALAARFNELVPVLMHGERELARRLDAPLALLHRELSLEPNPIPVKWALADMNLIHPGIRLPLTWLSAAAQPRIRSALHAAQPAASQSRACSA